ncbi:MAG TPA: PilZ domain-containing protein [Patescibacteria group bacterium]|nr:PilZ domain-containing protein [Patescibacteria group bacterium]
MPPEDPKNRREQPRIARRLPVRFGTERRMCGGVAVDISEGGLRIVATEGFPVHSLVDVLVQFPGHAIRLRARVMWTGGAGGAGAGPVMGLAFTSPEPALAGAYKRWLAEVKQAATTAESPLASAPASAQAPGEPKSAAPAPSPAAPEPKGPVKRRLESPQGQAYDVLLDPQAGGWRLTIVQLPLPPGVRAPDHEGTYPDYASAEAAMRAFVRAH